MHITCCVLKSGSMLTFDSVHKVSFSLRKPWDESDNNHECIAKGIQRGSCATTGIMPLYPVVCRRKDWDDLELSEWDWSNLGNA